MFIYETYGCLFPQVFPLGQYCVSLATFGKQAAVRVCVNLPVTAKLTQYMKKENSIQFATVQMVIDGKESKHSVKYISLERLSQSVFDLVLGKHCEPDNIILTLADGRSYRWCYDMAHYCFAKGRVSVEDFVKFQFVEEERV